MSLRKLISNITGCRYHYRVELKYRDRLRRVIASCTMTINLTHPRFIEDFRQIKKVIASDLLREIPKRALCNGELIVEPICYMGYFKPQNMEGKAK